MCTPYGICAPPRRLSEAVQDLHQRGEEFGFLVTLPDPTGHVGRVSDVHIKEAAEDTDDVGEGGNKAVRGAEHSGVTEGEQKLCQIHLCESPSQRAVRCGVFEGEGEQIRLVQPLHVQFQILLDFLDGFADCGFDKPFFFLLNASFRSSSRVSSVS